MKSSVLFIFLIILSLSFYPAYGQVDSTSVGHFYLQPEWLTGKIVPMYKNAPASIRQGMSVCFASRFTRSPKSWVDYYNQPYTGISVSFSNLGEPDVYGNEVSIIPYLMFNPLGKTLRNLYLKTGLGMAYYNKPYDKELNPDNQSIGSHLNWTFQLFGYYEFPIMNRTDLVLGCGYLHSSNGHTRLPNVGLNSAMFSLSANIDLVRLKKNQLPTRISQAKRKEFLQLRQGLGRHALGGSRGPVGGENRTVWATSFSYGMIFRNHLKVRAGFTYRHYDHYHDLIVAENIDKFADNPALSASNVLFFLGSEFLIRHFSIDIEGGLNLYKPFYREFFQRYQGDVSSVKFFLNNTFTSRLGIQYYLLDTEKNPRYNIYTGAHINANFGQADFSSVNFGVVYRL